MNLLIKLLIFSFPFVFVAALFWPAIEQKSQLSSQPIIEEDPLLKPSPIIENYKPRISSKKTVKQKTAPESPQPTSSAIYRWVDETGQVHFSNEPSHETAVAYTPKRLGSLNVSADIKQRVAVDEYRVAKITERLLAEASYLQTHQTATKPAAASYQFSNTSVGQKHGYILMSGRVSGGEACKQLRITAYAQNDMGRSASGRDDIRISGSGSRLFEMKVSSRWKGGGKRRPQWEITNVTAYCLRQ